ncbi:MAG: effector-associated domain EAD1-containing protein [Cyanobacteria bacterium J06635_10]
MGLSGKQRENLCEALIDAFPSSFRLEKMLSFRLNKNLNDVEGNNLEQKVFYLVKVAEAENWIENLIKAANQQNPRNQLLNEVAAVFVADMNTPRDSLVVVDEPNCEPGNTRRVHTVDEDWVINRINSLRRTGP